MNRWMWAALGCTGALATLYGLTLWAMYHAQTYMIFPAPDLRAEALHRAASTAQATELSIPTADGETLYGWHIPGTTRRCVLFFHGNGSTPANIGMLRHVVGPEWHVVSVAYRGYPTSTGTPSEAGLREDARATWRYVTEDLGFSPNQVVLHGRSLGGGVAIGLAAEIQPAGLVMESTFSSVEEIAKGQFPLLPISSLLQHPFRSWSFVEQVRAPVLVVHGTADQVVPVDHGRRMAHRFAGSQYVEREGFLHQHWLVVVDEQARDAYVTALAGWVPAENEAQSPLK